MKKQCNHTLESNNYNIRAHFLYCPRMNSFKYNLSNSSAEVTGCTFIFKILLHLFYYCFCYTYTYKIIVCSSMQRQRKTFEQNILHMLYIPVASPGTWGTNPLMVLSWVLGSCTLGTPKEKVHWSNTNKHKHSKKKEFVSGLDLAHFVLRGRAVSCMSPEWRVCLLLHTGPLDRGLNLYQNSPLSSPSHRRCSFWCTTETRQKSVNNVEIKER